MPVIEELLRYASVPVIVNPNAGIPRNENGKMVFDVSADEFADIMKDIAKMGASVLGGCCGTTPEYIRKTVNACADISYAAPEKKNDTFVSSYTHAVKIGESPVLIGERINPTGKSKFKAALREDNLDYIISEGISQEEKGAHILDVNVGLPEIDEAKMMTKVVRALQEVTALPLQIDTVNAKALETAMRIYNGKPLVNSVNGKSESMEAVLPLVAKYGGAVIALTLDENGIPNTAEGRVEIAERIVKRAAEYGIDKKDIIVDPLALTVSSDSQSAKVTLEAIKLIKEKLGVCTSLGVSNISFGLPNRDIINAAFFTMALGAGLDCAIMNPFSLEMMKSYHAFRALSGMDENCEAYVAFASGITLDSTATTQNTKTSPTESTELPPLCYAIVKGMKDKARSLTAEALGGGALPLEVINTLIVPALDIVGKGFEEKTVYLPQLLMSAEAAKSACEEVRKSMKATASDSSRKIVIATVKGDIHDIGKNIVKVLLENYGYSVIDLGKDVAPEDICRTAKESGAVLVGLSALMTTTVPAMEETIKQLRAACPDTKVMVGGAVLTQKYADMIGADRYCRDAMQAVRYAEEIFPE
jgi:5-methyltetrahydrofolate--homocysteine methyltransferase